MLKQITSNTIIKSLFILLLGGVCGYLINAYICQRNTDNALVQCSDLKTEMQKLWGNYAWWTRSYVIAALNDAPDLEALLQRLLKNQAAIADAFTPYYGTQVSEKLAELLKAHILIATELLAAAKARNRKQYTTLNKEWKNNTHAIATLLNDINPLPWTVKKITYLFDEIAEFTVKEVASRISKKWDADITAFDEIFNKAILMANLITQGITQQYPEKI